MVTGAAPLVVVVDDHPPILNGVAIALRASLPDVTVRTALVADELLEPGLSEDQRRPALVVLDLNLRDESDPAETVSALVQAGVPVLLYTQDVRPRAVQRCLRAGAAGIVGKDEELSVLVDSVATVLGGQPALSAQWAAVVGDADDLPELSPREAEALRLYATGLLQRTVARRMGISEDTVKEYLARVRAKYARIGRASGSQAELALRAVEDGYISLG